MTICNFLSVSDAEFLASSIRCWQDALNRGDAVMFRYWAVHCWSFARTIMTWDFFQRKVVLTSDDVQWCMAQEEFTRVGITQYEKFQALPLDDNEILGPHQSFSGSVRQILRDLVTESDAQALLLLEEDCIFRDVGHVEQAISELPADWDLLYFGANLVCWNNGEPWPERYSDHLFRVRAAWTTHCVGFNRKVVPFLLENQPGLSEQMFDNYLSGLLPHLNAYCVAPMVAFQRARHSTIWNRFDDYTPIFEASDARLR
jgi:hypothetical protein